MCFDHDSRPPIRPIAGGALDSREVSLTAGDGNVSDGLRGYGGRTDAARRSSSFPMSAGCTPSTSSSRCGSPRTASMPSRSTGSAGQPGSGGVKTASTTCRTSTRRRGRVLWPISAQAPTTPGRSAPSVPRRCSRSGSASAVGCRSWHRRWGSGWPARSACTDRPPDRVGPDRRHRPTSRIRSRRRSSASSAAPTRASRPQRSKRSTRPSSGRRRAPAHHLPECSAQLLRPQGRRVQAGIRRVLGRDPRVHPGPH